MEEQDTVCTEYSRQCCVVSLSWICITQWQCRSYLAPSAASCRYLIGLDTTIILITRRLDAQDPYDLADWFLRWLHREETGVLVSITYIKTLYRKRYLRMHVSYDTFHVCSIQPKPIMVHNLWAHSLDLLSKPTKIGDWRPFE